MAIQAYANGRKIADAGIDIAIATDFNPGSCTLQSMPIVMSLSVLYCGLTISEAFCGATWNSAKSINLSNKVGLIESGYDADLIIWNCNHLEEIPYWLGSDRIMSVMKAGEIIYEK